MNTNTYVAGSNDKDIVLERDQQLAKLLEDDEVLCAHVYDDNGYSEFLFHEQRRVIECSQKSTQKPRQNSRHPERRGRKRETWDHCYP